MLRKLSTLQIALLVSLVFHGSLLIIQRSNPQAFERIFQDSPLEVILVNARSKETPTQAQAIAQASLAGGGNVDVGRATSPLPPSPTLEVGDSIEMSNKQIEELQEEQRQLLARLRQQLEALPAPDPKKEAKTAEGREQAEQRRQLLMQTAEIEKKINEENSRPKKRYISPATKEAAYAMYYDRLRRKIEERGTRNFPESQGKKLYGELTLVLTVDSLGRVVDAEVVVPSKSKLLDKRALAIVKAAAPFGAFTGSMKREADQLEITSRFTFAGEGGLTTTLLGR
ncbi:energy transducer TonB [Piscinibacter terrae]|uniref:TonB family protein n=1 Tax=Piscinibacter terrae TaxID=2496871 RepID=A0A3N7HM63_9BURK|nr:TonB family protein [Albitalea terrae]RQP23257.1 TonB family protein [Albitalea terrae]